MNDGPRILLIDDEADILEFLSYNLISFGFNVEKANNGFTGIRLAQQFKPDLILLDLTMPGIDGIETCEQIRKIPGIQDVLIAFLTARSEDYSQLAGYEAGGDDYIIKPTKSKVLVSRINALLRRKTPDNVVRIEEHLLKFGSLVIDRMRYLVIISGREHHFPKKEFELLYLLASKPGIVHTREDIFNLIWGDQEVISERTIDVHILKLREKIGAGYIYTIKGVGYKFSPFKND